MPSLKQLTCTIQWAPTNIPFTEHGTMYGDGVVESFICVPANAPKNFAVHLCSKGFIYEGLAVVVYVDGQYHVNRNRINLIPPESFSEGQAKEAKSGSAPARRTEVEFLLRQKEKSHGDGLYMGRSWRFDDHNLVEGQANCTDDTYQHLTEHFAHLGMIEVVVLRCRARKNMKTDADDLSSAGDSDLLGRLEQPPSPLLMQETPIVVVEKKEKKEEKDQTAPVPEQDALGGLFGLFDGASEQRILRRAQVDGPTPGPYGFPFQMPGYPGGSQYVPSQEQHQPPARVPPQVRFDLPNAHGQPPLPSAQPVYGYPPFMPKDERSQFQNHPPLQRNDANMGPYPYRYGGEHYPYSSTRPAQHPSPKPIAKPHNQILYDVPQELNAYLMMNPPLPGNLPGSILPAFSGYPAQGFEHLPPLQRPEYPTNNFPWVVPPHLQMPDSIPTQSGPPVPNANTTVPPPLPPPPPPPPPPGTTRSGLTLPPGYGQDRDYHPKVTILDPCTGQNQDPAKGGGSGNSDQDWNQNYGQTENTASAAKNDEWGNPHHHHTTSETTDSNWGAATKDNNDANGQNGAGNDWRGNNTNNNAGDGWGNDNNNNNASNDWSNDTNNIQQPAADNNWTSGTSDTQQQQQHVPWSAPPLPPPPPPPPGSEAAAQMITGKRIMYGPYGPWESASDLASHDPEADAPEEPRYDIPRWYAEDIGSTKQVVPGPGFLYYKKSRAPEYIDTLAEPYARFVFKYRTKDELKKEFNIDIEVEQTPEQPCGELVGLDKQALIDRIAMYEQKFGRLSAPELKPPKPAVKQRRRNAVGPAPPDRDFLEYVLPDVRPMVNQMNFAPAPAPVDNANNGNNVPRVVGSNGQGIEAVEVKPMQNSDWNS